MRQARIVLIPSYQPDKRLTELSKAIWQAGLELVVIDDGSGLQYEDIFGEVEKYAKVLRHKVNCGKGCAIKTGLSYILNSYGENCLVATMDSDGQHTVSDVLRLFDYAAENTDSLILGSRRLKKNVPMRSRFGNTATRLVYEISTGLKIHDTQTGLRGFSGKMLPKLLGISGQRYEYEMKVLLECADEKIPIKELEIETIYFDKNSGSHFDTMKDSYRVYKEIIKFSSSSFVGFVTDYTLYGILSFLTSGLSQGVSIRLSNIGARIVSSCVNYTINRKLVFKSSVGVVKSAVQYFILALIILIGNTFMLSILAQYLKINRYAAKLITEMMFFIISCLVQHFIIFKRQS